MPISPPFPDWDHPSLAAEMTGEPPSKRACFALASRSSDAELLCALFTQTGSDLRKLELIVLQRENARLLDELRRRRLERS